MIRRRFFASFMHIEFGFAMLALIMNALVYIGNPRISNSILCWHHIPEMFSFYFIGMWLSKIHCSKKLVVALYLLTVLGTPIILGAPLFIEVFIFASLLFLPLILGFIVRKMIKYATKRI